MRAALVALAVSAALTSASPAAASFRIVNEHQQPVGGQLQTWANQLPYGHGDVRVVYANPLNLHEGIYTARGEPIYIAKPEHLDRYAFTHELGHHIDYAMNDTMRAFIQEHVLHRAGPWRSGGGNSPHEQFAEAVVQATARNAVRDSGYGFDLLIGPRRRALLRRVLTSPTDQPNLLQGLLQAHQERTRLLRKGHDNQAMVARRDSQRAR